MNCQFFSLRYLLILIFSLPCLWSTGKESQVNEQSKTIQVKVLINKVVNQNPKVQNNTLIKLASSSHYSDLKSEILKKSYPKTLFLKTGHRDVKIFQNPPSPANIFNFKHNKKLTKQGIKDGDQLYAILHNKDIEESKNITVFVDYEHSNKIVMVTFKATKKEKDVVKSVKKIFKNLLKKDKNNIGLSNLNNPNTRLFYPTELVKLAVHDHESNHDKKAASPFVFLVNGDRLSMRVNPPKPITVTIKTMNGAKTEKLEGIFHDNAYIDDIIKYLQQKLHWNIEDKLWVANSLADNGLPEEKALEELSPSIRLERCDSFKQNNSDSMQDHIVCYVKQQPNHQSPKNHVKNKDTKPTNQATFTLVINKLATSESIKKQNPIPIKLAAPSLGHRSATIGYLKTLIKLNLIEKTKNSQLKHNYKNIESKLMIYAAGPDKKLKKIETENKNYSLTLQDLGIELHDRVYAIIVPKKPKLVFKHIKPEPHDQVPSAIESEGFKLSSILKDMKAELEAMKASMRHEIRSSTITSKQNSNKVSFFVDYEGSKKIALITVSLNRKNRFLEQRKKDQIHQQVIEVFQRFEKARKDENNLPLWDLDVLAKTELVGKKIFDLENGDLIKLRLKASYKVNITIAIDDGSSMRRLTSVSAPLGSSLKSLFEIGEKKAAWEDHEAEPMLFLKSDKDESTDIALALNQSLKQAGISRSSTLYLKKREVKKATIHDDKSIEEVNHIDPEETIKEEDRKKSEDTNEYSHNELNENRDEYNNMKKDSIVLKKDDHKLSRKLGLDPLHNDIIDNNQIKLDLIHDDVSGNSDNAMNEYSEDTQDKESSMDSNQDWQIMSQKNHNNKNEKKIIQAKSNTEKKIIKLEHIGLAVSEADEYGKEPEQVINSKKELHNSQVSKTLALLGIAAFMAIGWVKHTQIRMKNKNGKLKKFIHTPLFATSQ